MSSTEYPFAYACKAPHNRSDAMSAGGAVTDTTHARARRRAPARARTSSARRSSRPRRAGTCRRALGVLAGYSRGTHWVLTTKLKSRVLTGYSGRYSRGDTQGTHRGTHRELTGYSQGTRRVLARPAGACRGRASHDRRLFGCAMAPAPIYEWRPPAAPLAPAPSLSQRRRLATFVRGELYINRRTRRS